MDLIEGILTRRSIRYYANREISQQQLDTILKAGMYAPSASNQQPWHFIVIKERQILDKIKEVHPYAKMLSEANMAILVCGDTNIELSKGYWVVDCSAATQNMLLAVHGLGLGAVWLGIYPRVERINEIRTLFDLPENIQPLSLISIGYPNEQKEMPDRFKPERVHYNSW